MNVNVIGAGPAGLYFAILLKKASARHAVTVFERNRPDDTFGFGVVLSHATQDALAGIDAATYADISKWFHHWDDIDIHYHGRVLSSTGHGFSGLARTKLLEVLAGTAELLGVDVRFQCEVTDVEALRDAHVLVAADGFNSTVRERYAAQFQPEVDWRPNRFVWLGTTRPFSAFTFYFKRDSHGWWRGHCYQYDRTMSTFIVECREDTWQAAGLEDATERDTIVYCERLFAEELEGHRLVANRSIWRSFGTLRTGCWRHGNVVLVGDAAHTAHFSVGSGTKLAMEDAAALALHLDGASDVGQALAAYEEERRPAVQSMQRAAQVSLQWFEDTERYMDMEPIQFAFNLLTRSLRVTHENLRVRDPAFVARMDEWFAEKAEGQSGVKLPRTPAPPPLFTPFKVRDLLLANRVVVSPMCQYMAEGGLVNDWHLVHLGARALGGAGLVYSEMTDVSAEARITPGCAGMYRPEHVGAWRRIVEFVHSASGAKVALQLGHAGRKAATRLAWEGMDEPLEQGDWPIVSASPIPYFPHSKVPKEMTREDMDVVREDFVRATEMAVEAGFDWIEVHMAHGYLLASYISPLTNRRKDEYGGSLENRMRFPLEVLDAVRAAWPAGRPLSARISAVDWKPGGMKPSDSVEVARMLKAHNCDLVDVSAGQTVPDAKPEYGRQFQTPFADRIRHEVGIYTMAVGNISSYEDVNTILAAGRADLAVMARAHLWDPYWTRHAAHELGHELRWPPPYESLDRYTPRFK
jgi:anthraniloyl-CoA monooxygenase